MFNEIFNSFLKEADELMKEFDNDLSNEENNNEKKDENNKSYFHYVNNTYRNGKLVEHQEKEVKDGKVLKDEKKVEAIEDKQKVDENVNKLNLLLKEKDEKIKNLENLLVKYENENKVLKEKFDKVKNLFN